MLVAALWCCMWGRGREGALAPASLSSRSQFFTPLPTMKLSPSGTGSWVGGLVHTLGPCGSVQRPLLWGWESLLLLPQPPRAFSIRDLRLYFPALEPWVSWSASLPTICPVYLCVNVGPWSATHRSACPVLRHSESGPLGLSVCECGAAGSASGQTACPVRPTLCLSWSHHGHTSLLCPGCPSPPLLPVWMNVYFLFPWCRTSWPFNFLSGLVVRGGAVCLPMPPSWFISWLF